MHCHARKLLTAGVAALGAGSIALSPVSPVNQQLTPAEHHIISNLAVDLAASIDPITPIVNTITTSFANLGNLGKLYGQQPTSVN